MKKATIYDYARMCKAFTNKCRKCPLNQANNTVGAICSYLLGTYPDKANEIILNWCKEHPAETRQDRERQDRTMTFKQTIVFDFTLEDWVSRTECHLNWWELADSGDYEIKLSFDNEVIFSGSVEDDNILEVIDAFLKGVTFSGQEEVTVIYGIDTPFDYYTCKRKAYKGGAE